MNCFQWQTRVSDILDGTLIGSQLREAEEHLESCFHCNQKSRRYLQIRSLIANQPRSVLPIPIRKSPLYSIIPRIDHKTSRARWEKTPWYIRTSVEGMGITFIILFIIAMAPRIRNLYQKSIDQQLDLFATSDLRLDSSPEQENAAKIPLVRGKSSPPGSNAPENNAEDFQSEHDSETPEGKVGASEIWRFNLKTDSPHEVRTKIIQILTELHTPPQTPGLGGFEAPGGIQFDLILPQSSVLKLRVDLKRLTRPTPSASSEEAQNEPFTWYKNKSKKQLPPGKARVVIWLSQI